MNNRFTGVVLVAFAIMALIAGCGGGGAGGGTSGGTTSGTTAGSTTGSFPGAGQFLEFRTLGNVPKDPLNLNVGDQLKVEIVNYDPTGLRTVIPASSLTVFGGGASSYSISGGVLTVLSQPTDLATIRASGVVSGQTRIFNQDVLVTQNLTTSISGRILSTDGTTGVAYLQVEFYDAGGNFVGGAVTDFSGNFIGKTQDSAKFLTIKDSTIPVAYYKSMRYMNVNYAVLGFSCPLTLPPLSVGVGNALPASIFLSRQLDGPPPPPDGCQA